MIEARLSLKMTCPWMSRLMDKFGAKANLLSCKPMVGSRGAWALARLLVSANEKEVLECIRGTPNVMRSEIVTLSDGRYLVAVATKSCPCRAVTLTNQHALSVNVKDRNTMLWDVLVDGHDTLKKLLRFIRDRAVKAKLVRVSRVRERSSLTLRQEQAIQAALALGFYSYPRKTSLTQLARIMNVSPTTLAEILRRAERKAISSSIETLY